MTIFFHVPLVGLLTFVFLRHTDYSALSIGRWASFGLVAVVMPLWWGVSLDRTLRRHGVELTAWQRLLPSWCPGATALLALDLFR